MKRLDMYGVIDEEGKLSFRNKQILDEWIKSNPGKKVMATFSEDRKKRSDLQNQYYWGVVVPLVRSAINDLGNTYTTENIHDFLKTEFNCDEVQTESGAFLTIPKSTTKLNTLEFCDFKERIQQFASEVLGIYIPDPDPHYKSID